MKLTFQNSDLEEREIANVKDTDEALKEIEKFCDERGFNIPYTRYYKRGNVTIIDVSSHFEFFNLYDDEPELGQA